MSSESTVMCPKCGHEFDLSDSFIAPFLERERLENQKELEHTQQELLKAKSSIAA